MQRVSTQREQTSTKTDHACWCQQLAHIGISSSGFPLQYMACRCILAGLHTTVNSIVSTIAIVYTITIQCGKTKTNAWIQLTEIIFYRLFLFIRTTFSNKISWKFTHNILSKLLTDKSINKQMEANALQHFDWDNNCRISENHKNKLNSFYYCNGSLTAPNFFLIIIAATILLWNKASH